MIKSDIVDRVAELTEVPRVKAAQAVVNGEPPIAPLPRLELLPPPQPLAYRPPPLPRPRWGRALVLLFLTFLTVTTLGPIFLVSTRTDLQIAVEPYLTPQTVVAVWRNPVLFAMGLQIS